jgi:hypothetical protein
LGSSNLQGKFGAVEFVRDKLIGAAKATLAGRKLLALLAPGHLKDGLIVERDGSEVLLPEEATEKFVGFFTVHDQTVLGALLGDGESCVCVCLYSRRCGCTCACGCVCPCSRLSD